MSIRAESLAYTYPRAKEPVIKDVSFEAPEGKVSVIIGANGVGKSTLLKAMLGIFNGKGETFFNGENRREMSHAQLTALVGYMTQENALLTGLNVLSVVLLGRLGSLHIRVQQEDVEKAMSMLRLLHLESYAERPFYALSGGQRRMVDVAQTLVRDPRILIMDEPTANLDLVNEMQVLELVRAYTHQRGTATLLTLHDLNMASRYADRMILLKDGRVYREGPPSEVITEENIRQAYGVHAHVHTSSRTGTPMLLPLEPVHGTEFHF